VPQHWKGWIAHDFERWYLRDVSMWTSCSIKVYSACRSFLLKIVHILLTFMVAWPNVISPSLKKCKSKIVRGGVVLPAILEAISHQEDGHHYLEIGRPFDTTPAHHGNGFIVKAGYSNTKSYPATQTSSYVIIETCEAGRV
jgi:hypothetical protein